jgi:Xaa-Pro aminopeptidase
VFSRPELEKRRSRLLQRMESEALDAIVLFANKVEAGYVRYYAGYESQLAIQDCSFLVVTPGFGREWTLVTNAFWDEPFGMPGFNETIITSQFGAAIAQLIPSGARSIGIAPMWNIPAPVYLAMAKESSRNLRDITELVLRLRAVKSAEEIELLKRVAALADKAAPVLLEASRPGVSEFEIAAAIEHTLRQAGSDPFMFSTILCSGPRTANFIALPGERKLRSGDLVQLDCGPCLEGYRGDFSRVISVGEPDHVVGMMLEATARMYETCLQSLRCGVRASEVARDVIRVAEQEGFGPEHLYQSPNVKPGFVGHGIGLGNPDVPQLSTSDDTMVEEGMVINIETILRIPGRGGSRIEDAVVVGKNGATRLSASPIRLWQNSQAGK